MKDKLEKLNHLKDKIQARINDVDILLCRASTLSGHHDLLDERIRLHKVLDDVYTDINIMEYLDSEPEK